MCSRSPVASASDEARPSVARSACVGKDSLRRANANEVDLNHPFIALSDMFPEFGNPALDCLQSFIDSLVESGRFDDKRLGLNFWNEWSRNVTATVPVAAGKKRKRQSTVSLSAVSLYNSCIGERTIDAMVKSGVGQHIGVLDLTGISSLTDDSVTKLLSTTPNLRRLSLKNCRRISGKALKAVAEQTAGLACLDIGGSYNISTLDVLTSVPDFPQLEELYASGLGWTDASLEQLTKDRSWKGLGIGFSITVTAAGIRQALGAQHDLRRLSLAFCEQAVDGGLLGFLGRALTKLTVLDIRGNQNVSSMTNWFDGRAAVEGVETQELFVLARYSNIGKTSAEETKRIHPLHAANLVCVVDGGGTGKGIRRKAIWLE